MDVLSSSSEKGRAQFGVEVLTLRNSFLEIHQYFQQNIFFSFSVFKAFEDLL